MKLEDFFKVKFKGILYIKQVFFVFVVTDRVVGDGLKYRLE